MKPIYRPYQTEEDYWRMRAFIREVFVLNGYRERCWSLARLDYARWHSCLNCNNVLLNDIAHLWEVDGKLVAIAMPDGGPDEAYLMIHPDWKTRELEEAMLTLAEEKLSVPTDDGKRMLQTWALNDDTERITMLQERGYQRGRWVESMHHRDMSLPIVDVSTPADYTLRSLGDGLELLERCYASGLGFHEGDIKVAVENRDDVTWYRNIQNGALYRRDLDLVAIAPDGSTASFCTIWFDDVNRTGNFEPVATVPAHQRKGLCRALLTEGLKRLKKLGALHAYVSGYEPGPNALYASIMGGEFLNNASWVKTW
jgi:GNAT superfamily N-acetyltransferase